MQPLMILVPVPYLDGDVQDANHIRVANHHRDGLTYSTVRIYGHEGTREVRSVSSPDRPRHPLSYLVHLKPVPSKAKTGKRLKCADIPTHELLNYVKLYTSWPTAANYRQWTGVTKFDGVRLAKRKEDTLVHRGYVTQYDDHGLFFTGRAFLTPKGRAYLEKVNA